MNRTQQLRNLPAVDEVLRHAEIVRLPQHGSRQLTAWVRTAVDACRQRVLAGEDFEPQAATDWIVALVTQQAAEDDGQRLQHVINATGVLLHTNLGRAPLARRARERIQEASCYANVELNLATGKRSKRGERVCQLIAELVGAEAALVVNNCAAATMLVLQATASQREVIVSRGQLVEIGGGFRLPEVFAAAGVRLREVGTTNRTYVRDYESAAGPETGAVIRVHRSNFRQSGFVTEPTIAELVHCRRPEGVPVIDDVGSGCLYDFSAAGLDEPNVIDSLAAGADVTLFSGDKLFGGPQCGIVVGRQPWIDSMRVSPMMRAVRVDKLTLAALEATVEIHLAGNALSELPVLAMLTQDVSLVHEHCETALEQLGQAAAQVKLTSCESQIGGGAMPEAALPSFGLQVETDRAEALARQLRTGSPAVQARVVDERLLLDFRTVMADEIQPLVARLTTLLRKP